MYKCSECGKEYEKRQAYAAHVGSHKRGESYKLKRETKKSKERRERSKREKICKFCGKEFPREMYRSLGGHMNNCSKNPKVKEIRKKISKSMKGKKLSEETKLKVSIGMKLAHKEGRAWNIGRSRWNNEKSYPEKFFEIVIINEFKDKNYTCEFPIGNYSIDFAWVDKKLAIEIDGSQHERFKEIIERDKRKDELLKSKGWKVLRIKWKDLYNETKTNIQIAKNFIDEN